MNKHLPAIFIVLGLIAGTAFGWLGIPALQSFAENKTLKNDDIRQAPDRGHFTSPLLECAEMSESVSGTELLALHSSVETLINKQTKQGNITYASVYFRDLNNGPWFGVNESDEFFPASLLKLPLAMSFIERSESDSSLLDQKITYTPDPSTENVSQPFGPQSNVESGKQYTIQELVDIMLKESSNEAAVALAKIAIPNQILGIYHDLGLEEPQMGHDYKIDTHKYASFFRILYNATYLDRPASEKMLKTLSEASFDDGLVAGVPKGITVSHKFGTRQVDDSGKVQLHDCGIIYAKDKPYILCIMTQGNDFLKLADFIKGISKTVYSGVMSKS